MDFENFVVTPTVMLLLVFGIVEYLKSCGVRGQALRLASLTTGVLIAVIFKLRQVFPAAVVYIDISFYGLAAGLAASGIYDYLKKTASPPARSPNPGE